MNRTEIEGRPSIPVTAEASPEDSEGLLQEMQRTGERESTPHSSHAASLSDSSIAQDSEAVNMKEMPDSVHPTRRRGLRWPAIISAGRRSPADAREGVSAVSSGNTCGAMRPGRRHRTTRHRLQGSGAGIRP